MLGDDDGIISVSLLAVSIGIDVAELLVGNGVVTNVALLSLLLLLLLLLLLSEDVTGIILSWNKYQKVSSSIE